MRAKMSYFSAAVLLFFATGLQAEVVLRDLTGAKIPFSSLQGKWVFINFWASWCQPCVDEIPELNRFYEQNKAANFAMFAVNYDALSLDEQKKLINQLGIRYPTLSENPAGPLRLGDIRGVPVTFVFNPEGELSDTLYGGQTVRSLSRAVSYS